MKLFTVYDNNLPSPGSIFSSTAGLLENNLFWLFWDEKDSINPYLLNLIFEFSTSLHVVCLRLLQCARYHSELNLL